MIASNLFSTRNSSTTEPYVARFSGDSIVAAYAGGSALASIYFSEYEKRNGFSADSIAVPGDTIAQQKAAWLASSNKLTLDVVCVQVGVNNILPLTTTASQVLTAYQDYINTIRSGIKSGAKIVASLMTPCNGRWPAVSGDPTGCQAKWQAINDGISGGTITGLDGVVTSHVPIMGDVSHNLLAKFESYLNDHIHDNNAGRKINAREIKKVIDPLFA